MKLQVTFTVDVEGCETTLDKIEPNNPLGSRIEDAVAEAVTNALAYAQGEGHQHRMSSDIAILMDSQVVAKIIE